MCGVYAGGFRLLEAHRVGHGSLIVHRSSLRYWFALMLRVLFRRASAPSDISMIVAGSGMYET